jgi:molybdopterin-guanine dinucleotide biosynthesis protein A
VSTGYGIFVGGKSSRMGRPKGLLPVQGEPLLRRLVRAGEAHGLRLCLVGDAAPYASLDLGLPLVPDVPGGAGPLGGLVALLRWSGAADVIAVACDQPYVTADAVGQLLQPLAVEGVLTLRRAPGAPLEPFFARYHAPRCLPLLEQALAEGCRSLQRALARLPVALLPATDALLAATHDWDTPEDVG